MADWNYGKIQNQEETDTDLLVPTNSESQNSDRSLKNICWVRPTQCLSPPVANSTLPKKHIGEVNIMSCFPARTASLCPGTCGSGTRRASFSVPLCVYEPADFPSTNGGMYSGEFSSP